MEIVIAVLIVIVAIPLLTLAAVLKFGLHSSDINDIDWTHDG